MRRQAAGRVEQVAIWVVALVLTCAAAQTFAAPAPEPKADAKRLNAELTQGQANIQEAQRGLSTSVNDVRDRLTELRRDIGALHDDVRQLHDLVQSGIDHNKEMREEVRGLYVESSGLKGDIAQADKQIDTLDQEIDSFRLSSGIIIALVIVLQFFLIFLTLRSRSGM